MFIRDSKTKDFFTTCKAFPSLPVINTKTRWQIIHQKIVRNRSSCQSLERAFSSKSCCCLQRFQALRPRSFLYPTLLPSGISISLASSCAPHLGIINSDSLFNFLCRNHFPVSTIFFLFTNTCISRCIESHQHRLLDSLEIRISSLSFSHNTLVR